MADDGWTPKLSADGKVFCSPRCGFKCLREGHERAVTEAANLCNVLGKGWKPRVWENGGWHFEVVKGPMVLHVSYDGSRLANTWKVIGYTAEIRLPSQLWPYDKRFAHPCEAVAYTLDRARSYVADAEAAIKEASA